MKNDPARKDGQDEGRTPVAREIPSRENKLGSVDIVIKEIDLSRPARSVNRIWPNR